MRRNSSAGQAAASASSFCSSTVSTQIDKLAAYRATTLCLARTHCTVQSSTSFGGGRSFSIANSSCESAKLRRQTISTMCCVQCRFRISISRSRRFQDCFTRRCFINPTLLGAMPGYYNSAYGITATFTPVKNIYLSYGVYDGNIAHGVQTGLHGAPNFNGYYFHVGEAGGAWEIAGLPGSFGMGGWRQTGQLSTGPPSNITENGASGFFLFGSQRFWRARPNIDNSGISGFAQFGVNNSDTLPIDHYFGAGLTEFGLVPHRAKDSAGVGLAWSSLNQNSFKRDSELMLQAYYQAHITHGAYFEPAISYIPTPGIPGANPDLDAAWALTLRVICLF